MPTPPPSARPPQPTVLRGAGVLLEPLGPRHVPALFAAYANDAEVFRWLRAPAPRSEADMASLVDALLTEQRRHGSVAFAVTDTTTRQVAGWTRYQELDLARAHLHLGSTWYGRHWWGSPIHPATRLLLLRHAFEELGMSRVQWLVATENLRNQRTLDALGATREGVLRHYSPQPDGSRRDVVMYSVIEPEWPAVEARLSAVVTERRRRPAAAQIG